MAIRQGMPSVARAAGRNPDLRRALTATDNRLTAIEKATSHLAANPTTQRPQVSVPPSSRMGVNGAKGTGQFQVSITLPHLINPPAGRARNQSLAPIFHEISYAPTADFKSNVTVLPPSTQTFFPINLSANSRMIFRIRSSFDGKNWGPYIRSGLVAA